MIQRLARRFLLSKSSDGFLSLIAWVSVAGVAVGVLALVCVTSVINGFEGELRRVITGMNGDVILYSRGETVGQPDVIEKKIREVEPKTQAITRSFTIALMTAGPSGVAGSILEGVDQSTLGQVTLIPQRIVSGRLPENENEVALGSALADRIGAQEGSPIRLIIPFGTNSPSDSGDSGSGFEGGTPKIYQAKVVGRIKMGMYEYDSQFVFMALPAMQKFLNQEGKVTTFKIKLEPDADSQLTSDHLADRFGYPFRAKNWAQLNRNLFYAIELEKAVIGIILTIIVIVAAFNVVSTLMMMIHDKTKEIAILKTMGFRPGQAFGLFCFIGTGMGLVGTLIGVSAGLFLSWLLQVSHLIDLPADIYYIGFLPVVIRWKEVGWIALVSLLISFLATLYPAIQVSRRSPIEGLRYE